jgi:hypothetical protein
MYIIILIAFWALYFSSESKTTFQLVWLLLCTAWVYWKFTKDCKKINASDNVVVAKETYEHLTTTEKEEVNNKALEIIRRSGWSQLEVTFDDEVQKFGWYALAMAELRIQPIALLKNWNFVKNPWLAIIKGDEQLKVSQYKLEKALGN